MPEEDVAAAFVVFLPTFLRHGSMLIAKRNRPGFDIAYAFVDLKTAAAARRAIEATLENGGIAFCGCTLRAERSENVSDVAALKRLGAREVRAPTQMDSAEEDEDEEDEDEDEDEVCAGHGFGAVVLPEGDYEGESDGSDASSCEWTVIFVRNFQVNLNHLA